jgi:uncharacterized membrane protein
MTDMTQPSPQNTTGPAVRAAAPVNDAVPKRSLGLAIASLFFALTVPIPVWGLFMLFLAAPLGIAALINGHTALRTLRPAAKGRGKAQTALVLGYSSLAICAFTTLFWVITMATPR